MKLSTTIDRVVISKVAIFTQSNSGLMLENNFTGYTFTTLEAIWKLELKCIAQLGSFNNDDSDSNKNIKPEIALLSKTTSLHVHHAFLYISLPLLHDHDMKVPNFTF